MNELKIRQAATTDLAAIGELWEELMDFHEAGDSHYARSPDGREQFVEFIAGHMKSEQARVWVAELDGEVVGYCLSMLAKYPPVFAERDYGSVFDLAVRGSHRRQGIGALLYRTASAWFAEHGVRRIEIGVAVTNPVSTAFWNKLGFRPYLTRSYVRIE